MTTKREILNIYHHLLMLDDKNDKEKRWINQRQPMAKGLATVHFHILSYLLANPETVAKQICDDLSLLRGTLSKQLTLLQNRGLVTYTVDARDARYKRYTLTANGKSIARTHNELLVLKNNTIERKMSDFSEADLHVIYLFLSRLADIEEQEKF
ncbi:MarR family winged helix-turn-helix transcriptional regulator [Loigolactobacillus bifermentans]|nr:helix-turn-helix domain-containing protein [Loigolactobacillus bifermentans]QGG59878.1 ArsR family transcriptional regulator [Loigolactobacillus bifermentans]